MASGGNHRGSDQNRLLLGRLTQLVTSLNQNKAASSQQPRLTSVDEMLSRIFPSGNRTVSQSVTRIQSTCTVPHSNYIDVLVSNIDILMYL